MFLKKQAEPSLYLHKHSEMFLNGELYSPVMFRIYAQRSLS